MAEGEATALERRKRELIARHGPWTAHNVYLDHGVFTIGRRVAGQEVRVGPLVQLAADMLGGLEGRRVLDLACMEGLFAIEFGRRGANVLGIEGREGHVARASFAREAIGLQNVEFRHGDVRSVSIEDREFDLVLALGILYHLDSEDLFGFVRRLPELTRLAVIIDTHYALRAEESWKHEGSTYSGISVREHDPTDSAEERERQAGSSLDNVASTWLTKPSLFNLLADVGFTSVFEARVPAMYPNWDRVVLVALRGEPVGGVASAPQLVGDGRRWTEDASVTPSPQQARGARLARKGLAAIPGPVRRRVLRRRRLEP